MTYLLSQCQAQRQALQTPPYRLECIMLRLWTRRAVSVVLTGCATLACASWNTSAQAANGSVVAHGTWNKAQSILYYSASMAGWKRGSLSVDTQYYSPNHQYGPDYRNDCSNSTSCSTNTYNVYCPIPGTWTIWGDGYRGTAHEHDTKSVTVSY